MHWNWQVPIETPFCLFHFEISVISRTFVTPVPIWLLNFCMCISSSIFLRGMGGQRLQSGTSVWPVAARKWHIKFGLWRRELHAREFVEELIVTNCMKLAISKATNFVAQLLNLASRCRNTANPVNMTLWLQWDGKFFSARWGS